VAHLHFHLSSTVVSTVRLAVHRQRPLRGPPPISLVRSHSRISFLVPQAAARSDTAPKPPPQQTPTSNTSHSLPTFCHHQQLQPASPDLLLRQMVEQPTNDDSSHTQPPSISSSIVSQPQLSGPQQLHPTIPVKKPGRNGNHPSHFRPVVSRPPESADPSSNPFSTFNPSISATCGTQECVQVHTPQLSISDSGGEGVFRSRFQPTTHQSPTSSSADLH